MRLAVVYNPQDPKLLPTAYSWTYRDMFMAVLERFAPVQRVTASCEAATIEAEAILFYDVHSTHEIEIAGIEKHHAVKLEYFNDPHQPEQVGQYRTGQRFHKLSAVQRCDRARRRGVRYVICPYREGFERYLAPYAGDLELWWHPVAPANRRQKVSPLWTRRPEVLANGHLWPGENGFRPYAFRRWAFDRPGVTCQRHSVDGGGPSGPVYQGFLETFAAALALCDEYVVPKYLEIPLAGCLCLCQMRAEYREMGFEDGINCFAVNRSNFDQVIQAVRDEPQRYQTMATAGRELALQYTADRFADWLFTQLTTK
jgi:hypothetical protein